MIPSAGPSERSAQISLRAIFALVVVYGCWRVLAPFAPAIFFAVAIVVSIWPAHAWLLSRVGNRRALTSALSCSFVGAAIIVPIMLLFAAFREGAVWLLSLLDELKPENLPIWIQNVPIVGSYITQWREGAPADLPAWLSSLGDPTRKLLVSSARLFGNGIGQIALAALLLFALFRDGDHIAARIETFALGTGGTWAQESLRTVHRTIVGVMLGVLGTAIAQSVVAIGGFTIAGVPHAFLLGALTFVLSMAPIGPPLVWGGTALWLLHDGHPGWAVFMTIYGFLGISLIDNVIKPLFVSRSGRIPFSIALMGILGGVLAFGIAGVFIGPALLAVAINLSKQMLPSERITR